MSEDKVDTPEVQTPDQPKVQKPPSITELTLPDVTETVDDTAKLKEQTDREKSEMAEQLKASKEEKEALEKRLRDNQEYISRTRKADVPEVVKPARTFEDYLSDIDKIVDSDFENDPKVSLKKVARKLASDIAYDRDLMQQGYEKRLAESEERALKKVMSLNPEVGKAMHEVERLDEERPDLKNLTFEQKLEFVNMKGQGTVKRETNNRNIVDRERELGGDVSGSRQASKGGQMPGWVSDPAVIKEAQGHFKSKQEVIDWADPEKAKAMYLRNRK